MATGNPTNNIIFHNYNSLHSWFKSELNGKVLRKRRWKFEFLKTKQYFVNRFVIKRLIYYSIIHINIITPSQARYSCIITKFPNGYFVYIYFSSHVLHYNQQRRSHSFCNFLHELNKTSSWALKWQSFKYKHILSN